MSGSRIVSSTGAVIIRTGFWGPAYYNYNKEPQNNIGNYYGPYIIKINEVWGMGCHNHDTLECTGYFRLCRDS